MIDLKNVPSLVKWLGALIIALVGSFGPFLSDLFVRRSAISDENVELKNRCESLQKDIVLINERHVVELRHETERYQQLKDSHALVLQEKDARMAEQRESIASLERRLNTKELELKLWEIAKGTGRGKMLKRDADILPLLKGSIGERIGLAEGLPPEEVLRTTWESPLLIGMLPGVYIPAPKGMLEESLEMLTLYSKTNFDGAVKIAKKLLPRIDPMIADFVLKGALVDSRFAMVASRVYAIAAEDAFAKKDFRKAGSLMGIAAGIVGPTPSADLLAKEAIMAFRASDGEQGIFTRHIYDAIKNSKDDSEYQYQIHEELAKLGYLQLYLPNKEQTDIGEEIDWNRGTEWKDKIHTVRTFRKGDDIWSIRWAGFLTFEEYNLSEEFRRSLLKMRKSEGRK